MVDEYEVVALIADGKDRDGLISDICGLPGCIEAVYKLSGLMEEA